VAAPLDPGWQPWSPFAGYEQPPLADPYLDRRALELPKPGFSGAAIVAFMLNLAPLGALAAIPASIVARRHTHAGAKRGRWLANVSLALSVTLTIAYGSVGTYWFVHHQEEQARIAARAEEERRERLQAREEEEEEEASHSRTVPAPLIVPHAGPGALPFLTDPTAGTVPQETTSRQVGNISIVDIGVKETSLKAAIARQVDLARADNEEVMVMTIDSDCAPCDGVMRSMPDTRMQSALEHIRIVRVNVGVFGDDLEKLHIPHDKIPGYFLLAANMSPRDGIHGGEWDEDIPENIAPVIGPFVRGKYKDRRDPWRLGAGGGTFL
jgi:hypothetical protein